MIMDKKKWHAPLSLPQKIGKSDAIYIQGMSFDQLNGEIIVRNSSKLHFCSVWLFIAIYIFLLRCNLLVNIIL